MRLSLANVIVTGVLATALLSGCASTPTEGQKAIAAIPSAHWQLKFLGAYSLPLKMEFGATIVGGLSGIDYDPASGLYYIISDDRAEISPVRFYTARLDLDENGLHAVQLQTVVKLRDAAGQLYRPAPSMDVPDSESIRYDPHSNTVLWSSEGERTLKGKHGQRLIDPFVRESTPQGVLLREFPLPPMFHISAEPRGPRNDLVFEGLSLSPDGNSLWVGMEAPLIQDGPMPDESHGALVRITRYSRGRDGSVPTLEAQYAYPLDPIPRSAVVPHIFELNGASEILALSKTHLLVLERAFAVGPGMMIRLYEADTKDATLTQTIDSFQDTPVTPMTKRLVFNFDTLGIWHVDNLEGVSFGPTLANGHRTLVFVADDNFNPGQTNQFLAFEILDSPLP